MCSVFILNREFHREGKVRLKLFAGYHGKGEQSLFFDLRLIDRNDFPSFFSANGVHLCLRAFRTSTLRRFDRLRLDLLRSTSKIDTGRNLDYRSEWSIDNYRSTAFFPLVGIHR